MARTTTARPGRALAVVALVLLGLYLAVFLGPTQTPALGLDLQGGTSVTLTPKSTTKGKITKSSITKAVDIIRQRVNGLGVSEADVTTEGNNIIVSVPGKGRDQVVKLVGSTAQLRFRAVLGELAGGPTAPASSSPTASPGASAGSATPSGSASASPSTSPAPTIAPSPSGSSRGRPAAAALLAPTPTPSASGSANGTAAPSTPATPKPATLTPATPPAAAGQPTAKLVADLEKLDCRDPKNRQGGGLDDPKQSIIACDRTGQYKYLLAPAGAEGRDVTTADAGIQQNSVGSWLVNLSFNGRGTKQFGDLTTRLSKLQTPENQVAIVLDGVVQSAPAVNSGPILGGNVQITGSFTPKEAKDLATVLKYGALPLAFSIPTAETISPTLGADQLHAGLLAGGIGLLLVVLYSFVYYRGLGLVTVASLLVSALLLYAATTVLGHLIGYTLTLAGIAGFIVAVGITADSFVVFFERLRDEVREGKSLRSAVERAWPRARRTILSADTVSFLAAAVLYIFSIGSVRGFAFTLGLSTLSDVFIVFLFTKPLMTLLARTRMFGTGTRFSGLSAGRMGPSSAPAPVSGRPVRRTTKEA